MSEGLEIDLLEGVGPVTKQKLGNAGVYDIIDLASRGMSDISDMLGGDNEKASELINKARNYLIDKGLLTKEFIQASELYKFRLQIERISTGSKNLDNLLDGGIESGAVTELYGEFGSGKTQICCTLAVIAQLPKEQGGVNGGVIYLDTENTFRPERIAEIARARGLDTEKLLEGITVAKAYNSSHQELILKELGKFIEKEKVKLIVVDSVVSHYRADYLGRGTLAERQQRLNSFMHQLLRLAEIYNVAVVVTNQVQAAPDFFFGDPTRATGGHVVAHLTTYRIYLRKSSKMRIARMVDSPYHAEKEALFIINEKGVDDPPEERKK